MPRAHAKAYAEVALPTALRQCFTYAVPPALRETLMPGHRVRVRFGPRRAHGYVVGFTTKPVGVRRIRPIQEITPAETLFTPDILALTRWAADYYLASWGQMLESALPRTVRRPGTSSRRSPKLKAGAPELELPSALLGPERFTLFPEQDAAVREIAEALTQRAYFAFLLHGVTGSGKTEIYLRAAEQVIQEGGNVLFLVPEIAMGTQILARVERRFEGQVGLYHSQAGETNRRRVWREAREGRLSVVVGARSAVFVPLPDLRLVIVDEEHEGAYKQEESPRYHGRDVAIYRARQAGAVVILGSATPSLESVHNVARGKHRLIALPTRVDARPPSRVMVIDMAEERRTEVEGWSRPSRMPGATPVGANTGSNEARSGNSAGEAGTTEEEPLENGSARESTRRMFSPLLLREIQERLDRGEQTILFLNRRGHSTVVQCADCGQSIQCRECDVVMTWHRAEAVLRCHYCGAARREVLTCASCQGSHFFYGGFGTQKVEDSLRQIFPGARLERMDQDATRRQGAHRRLVEAMERGEIDILLGTQMVAKGFHFPRVTLVGVLQADREMLLPDFRASERAFQILTQVSGRAGRGDTPGEVVFQTLMPQHYVIASAASGDYAGFVQRELEYRHSLRYPPYHRMVHLLLDGKEEDQVRRRAEVARDFLGQRIARGRLKVQLLGPAPMPISRLRGQYRWHLTLKSGSTEALHDLATSVLDAKPPRGLSKIRIQADVDPLQMV